MKKFHALFAIAGFALFTQSCKIMYTPNMQNVPLFKEKNEVRATIGYTNYQAAYAVTDNIGIMANAQYDKSNWEFTSGSYGYKYESKEFLVEGGAGYFMPLGESGVFEAYGGGGIGSNSFNRNYSDTASTIIFDNYSTSKARFFVQPSIGMTNKNIDFAFSTRVVGLKFNNITSTGYTQEELKIDNLTDLDKPLFLFFEPALTFRVGWNYVKFHTQAIMSLKMNSEPLNYIPFSINFGAHINIAQRFNK